MERSLLILLSALMGFSGCLTVDGGNVQALEHALVTERSPDFDEDRSGHLDGEPTDLLPLDDAILACSDDGLSLSELDDDGAVGKERLETEASRSSEHAVACTDLARWGDHVAMSAGDRVRLYEILAPEDEPDWWADAGQSGPLGWASDILTADGDWDLDEGQSERDWETLGEVASTTYSEGLELGFIATCCEHREVLQTDLDAQSWALVQLVPEDEEAPERLKLATGLVDGERYLFGAGEDGLYAAALEGGPELTLPLVGAFLDGDPAQIQLVDSGRLWIGAGKRSVLYDLEAGAERWELYFDTGDASVLDAEATASGVSDYAYVSGEGVAIASHQTRASCTQSDRNGHAYLFCSATLSWTDARSQCTDYGAFDLVEINGDGENDWVWERSDEILGAVAWIGLSDRDAEGDYVWSTDEALDFEAWADGEPNDSGTEDCAHLYDTNATWNDADCSLTYAYICESLN